MRQRPSSFATTVLNPQLSLFVVFEKKVGLIRIVNSAVGEIAFFEEPAAIPTRESLAYSPSVSSSLTPGGISSLSGRRSRTSLDGFVLSKDSTRGAWTLPAKLDFPGPISIPPPSAVSTTNPATTTPTDAWDTTETTQPQSIYLVTRGKQSFALRCPLPANMQTTVPLLTFHWRSAPTYVVPRVFDVDYGGVGVGGSESSSATATAMPMPMAARRCTVLQLTAFSEDGLEIQETFLATLFEKDRSSASASALASSSSSASASASAAASSRAAEEAVVSSEVVLGETGFLCRGGHWNRPYDAPLDLSRSYSMRSGASVDTMATEEVVSQLELNQGTYGWQRRGLEDWRVFWIGGVGETDDDCLL